jgi:hypothetical protein
MYEFEPNAADADGDSLSFQVTNKPNWASFDASTGRLSGQPTLENVGTYGDIVSEQFPSGVFRHSQPDCPGQCNFELGCTDAELRWIRPDGFGGI